MPSNLVRRGDSKVTGTLKDGIYRKKVHKSIHFMRKLNAWGIDLSIVQDLAKQECTEVRIKDLETDDVWSTAFDNFKHSKLIHNYGHGKQVFVKADKWYIAKKDADEEPKTIAFL